jgi:hypothetical protein
MNFYGDHLSQFSVAATPSGRRTPLGPDDGSDGMDLPSDIACAQPISQDALPNR